MEDLFTILIVDNNSNVLSFFKRELVNKNIRVQTTGDTKTLTQMLKFGDKPDLLIIDPVLAGLDLSSLLKELRETTPEVPVIIHAYFSDFYDHPSISGDVFFIEREGGSIENMKKVVARIIKNKSNSILWKNETV